MKKIVLIFLLLSPIISIAQGKYWVFFKDKPLASTQLLQPQQFFSAKSIERKTRLGIAITSEDMPVHNEYIQSVVNFSDVILFNKSKWFNCISIQCPQNIIDQIEALPFVKSIQPIYNRSSTNKNLKVDYLTKIEFDTIQGFKASYGASLNQLELYNLMPVHADGFIGQDLTIAVLDAGFIYVDEMTAFDHLRDEGRLIATRDFVDGDTFLYDKHGHGTVVLATMAGYLPDEFLGAAYGANYVLCRTEDGQSESLIEEDNWVAAAEWADSLGVDIINSSLGYTVFDDSTTNHTYADMDGNTTIITRGADKAASKGILVVSSAGNSGNNAWRYIGAPADADSILSIGAVDALGSVASFSSYGPTYDGRIKPNVCAVGWGTTTVFRNDQVIKSNGTSFSSPLMAGAMASLWSKYPKATNMELIDAIEKSSHNYLNPDDRCGYGIPNFGIAADTLEKWEIIRYQDSIGVYPNPSAGKFKLTSIDPFDELRALQLIDISGKLVNSVSLINSDLINNLQIDLQGYEDGVYYLLMTYENGMTRKVKLVKASP